MKIYKSFFKRVFDILFSFIAIFAFLPFFLIIAIAIKIDSRGPVFFKQKRYGRNKKPFNILKFRSMSVEAPKSVPTYGLVNSDKYITKLGKFLRKTSLDELPQLFNIFVGQMSFIGPRPVILEEVDLIEERDKYGANALRPGISGWAQINGRDELGYVVKAKYDGEYAEKISLWFDIKCLFGTVFKVLKRDGVVEGDKVELKTEKVEEENG
ncbi:MAG: sugar transferase [Clostridia bacterium]|nr:sugar transferase [Clostridia bacterium]